MAITFVAAGAVVTGANPTVTVPAGDAEGDFLILITTGTATPTTPSGWTQLAAQGAGRFITILYKFAASSEPSVGVTLAGSTSKAVMLAYRSVLENDVITAFRTGSGTSLATFSQTTTVDNDEVISVWSVASGATRSWGNVDEGDIKVDSNGTVNSNGLLVASARKATAGATTAITATVSSSGQLACVAFSISPTPDATGSFFFLF